MKKRLESKKHLILGVIFATLFLVAPFFILPILCKDKINLDKLFINIRQKQSIAPQRLYINAWRIAKNEYIDKTMNNQNWYKWRNKYLKYIKTEEDVNIAINTMLYSLDDPYTKFLKEQSYIEQKTIMDSGITGIGIVFDKHGEDIIIGDILKNSSAQEKNLLTNDKVVSINNINVKNLSTDDVINIVENSNKKNIKIEVLRNNKKIKKILTKKIIPIETMQYFITNSNIGIIQIANVMGENALRDFIEIIHRTNETNGLIIDLRNNYGGILSNAILIADYMSDNKKLISIISKGKFEYEIYGDNKSIFKEKPLIVLVNNKTASSAEILAGILRDNLGAIIIGERTYGKNTIQEVIPMTNNSGLIITSNKYLLPSGEDISKIGIEPDISINQKNVKDISLILAVKIINNIMKI